MKIKKVFSWFSMLSVLMSLVGAVSITGSAVQAAPVRGRTACDDNGVVCTETATPLNYEGNYTGHDEPSLLFYSNRPGSGNSNVYTITLPKDPPVLPKQDGTGGTFNFQLHPAFWFGMAMCDTQSYPVYTNTCKPDSDSNIFENPSPSATDYIGHHPGSGYMEMQFYPPGWVAWPAGNSCDATKWCAALNIDSYSQSLTQINNVACQALAGVEYVNFAYITKSGVAHAPADPTTVFVPPYAAFTPNPNTDLFMNSGDRLVVTLNDTPAGFHVGILDLTSHQYGSMTASTANGFAQVKFDPSATSCTSIPYAFHPMYATSSEATRLPWTAHAYNVAFSDEIGHFEYCNAADANGNCTQAGVSDPAGLDGDDYNCFNAADSTRVQIGGCIGSDSDFDGVPYLKTWPGSTPRVSQNGRLTPQPVRFSSPLFFNGRFLSNYDRVAFETDLPRIEAPDSGGICNRTTGANCVNPPAGSSFYPFYSTTKGELGCEWQLGGAFIPGSTNTFGGSSTTEFGSLLLLTYPTATGSLNRYNDFRQTLPYNPCRVGDQ